MLFLAKNRVGIDVVEGQTVWVNAGEKVELTKEQEKTLAGAINAGALVPFSEPPAVKAPAPDDSKPAGGTGAK